MPLTARQIARPLVASDEGFRQFVYDDKTGKPIVKGVTVEGIPTIGFGFNLASVGLSRAECLPLLEDRLDDAQEAALSAVGSTWWLGIDPVRQGALVDMAYTMGLPKLTGFRDMLAAVRARDWPRAAAEVMDSEWARDEAPARAQRVADMLRTGNAP